MIRLLVTRPEPDAGDTAGRLTALGLEPTVFPLMTMRATEARLPDAEGLSGLIVTSANALRALAQRDALAAYLDLPLFAVGEKTAVAAGQAGFARIETAGGDAGALIDLVGARAKAGTFFYPCAAETARDLPKALASAGLLVIAAEIYRMQAATRLSEEIAAQLAEQAFAAVLIYSRRMAMLFAELTELVLSPAQRRALTLICLSENVAAPLVAHGFPRIVLADFPSEEAMMAATLSFSRGQITP
jgi:uroporphyrinogen-III synthase